jgi:hypothetical protein
VDGIAVAGDGGSVFGWDVCYFGVGVGFGVEDGGRGVGVVLLGVGVLVWVGVGRRKWVLGVHMLVLIRLRISRDRAGLRIGCPSARGLCLCLRCGGAVYSVLVVLVLILLLLVVVVALVVNGARNDSAVVPITRLGTRSSSSSSQRDRGRGILTAVNTLFHFKNINIKKI